MFRDYMDSKHVDPSGGYESYMEINKYDHTPYLAYATLGLMAATVVGVIFYNIKKTN